MVQRAVCNIPVPLAQGDAMHRIAGVNSAGLLGLNSLGCFALLADHCPADQARCFSINFQGLTQRVLKEPVELLTLYIPVTPQDQKEETFWSKCSIYSSLL